MTPARRAVLAIGVPLTLALIAWIGLGVVAQIGEGSYPVSFPIAVTNGTVNAHFGDATVTLRDGGGSAASLDGTVVYSLVRPHFTVSPGPNGTSVGEQCAVPAGECGLDAVLTVPRGTNAALSTGGGDLTVDGSIGGDVTLSSGGGDVTVRGLTGTVRISAGGGDVSAEDLTATRLTARSTSGDITLSFTQVPRDVQVSDTAGDVTIVLPPGSARYRVQASAGSGDVSDGAVPQSASSPNVITATSVTGGVTISEGS
jgi:hypothetical protein